MKNYRDLGECYPLQRHSFKIVNYSIKAKNSKTRSRHRNTVEYISGKSFLFISLKEKLNLTLFDVRRSQYFISRTKSLIFNGRL